MTQVTCAIEDKYNTLLMNKDRRKKMILNCCLHFDHCLAPPQTLFYFISFWCNKPEYIRCVLWFLSSCWLHLEYLQIFKFSSGISSGLPWQNVPSNSERPLVEDLNLIRKGLFHFVRFPKFAVSFRKVRNIFSTLPPFSIPAEGAENTSARWTLKLRKSLKNVGYPIIQTRCHTSGHRRDSPRKLATSFD